uniref:Uncharacterized protein n=1 Tax=Zea mays TaxID=4577 RepID=C0PG19_MAIZE|nr:unknown [Zea mays]
MHENATLPQRAEKVQALLVGVLILGRPLTRAALLPPIVMALQEKLVDQADCARVEQPRDQIELGPLHIHLHHHVVLLRHGLPQPLGKVKRRDTPDLAVHLLPGSRADAPHATAIGLGLVLLSRIAIDLESECLVLDPGCVRKQRDTLLCRVLRVERRISFDGEHLEGVVLLRVLLAEPAADTGAVAARANVDIQVPALEADIGQRREVLDVLDVSL